MIVEEEEDGREGETGRVASNDYGGSHGGAGIETLAGNPEFPACFSYLSFPWVRSRKNLFSPSGKKSGGQG